MTYYEVLLFVHLLGVAIWFGTGFALLVLGNRFDRGGDNAGPAGRSSASQSGSRSGSSSPSRSSSSSRGSCS